MRKTMRKKTAILLAAVMLSSAVSQRVWADNDRQQVVRPPIIEPVMQNTTIVNGAFEKAVDGFGNPEGWNIQVSKTSGPGGNVTYSLSQEEDNVNNTSKKLTLYNGMDEDITFSVTQTVYGSSYSAGKYVASVIYEGSWNEEDSGIVFQVNGRSAGLGMLEGWQKWKQAVIPNLSIAQGEVIEISIRGRLRAKEFLDLDDVELVPESQFTARQFLDEEKEREHPPYEPVRTVPEDVVQEYIQNGEFNEEICWDVYGYPQGYLPKWEIRAQDITQWDYWIADGVLEVKNISDTGGTKSIAISQKVHLKPGNYLLHGETGWVWDAENEDGVCMRVEDKRGVLIAERYWNPGYGRIISDEFTVKEEMDVTVSITIQLPQGANAAIDGIEITESPKKIKWSSAKQVGGVSEKEDTEQIRVTFSAPVFGLEEKHFAVEDAVVTKVSRDGGSAYLLHLEDVAFANEKEIEVKMTAPEYYDLDTKKKKVKVYRDMENISGFWNGSFGSGVDWNKENYPDGYIAGWGLPNGIDWDVWRYNITDGIFQVTNITENPAKKAFKIHQVVFLPKGTYSIKTNSPWTWDAENTEGIVLQVKDGKKLLAQASGCPGAGVIQSDTFTLEEDTMVDCSVILSVPGGKNAALQYVSLLPTETVSWKSAQQLGGESGSQTTEAVELVFAKDFKGLAAEHFQVKGAEVSGLESLGNGKYRLELSSLSVMDGEQITVSLDAPGGYLVQPSNYQVTVYRGEVSGYSTELINGDFSMEVDWSNPLYPDGYVEGWMLPDPIDWDTWRYYVKNGVFGVVNHGTDTAEFTIKQEIILPSGEFVLETESSWADGDTANSRVKISVEGEDGILVQAAAEPGTGVFATDVFELKKAAKVTVKVEMNTAPGCEINIDHVSFSKPGAVLETISWESAVQSGGKDELAESTGISLVFSQDILGLDADQITVTGADKGELTAEGNGKYHLEISGLTVKNGEEVTVRIKAPEGFQIVPASQKVTVYREVPQGGDEFEDPVVNGDFSVGVDWDNGGNLKGWTIDSVNWDVWNSYSGNGGEWGNFWVIRTEQTSDEPLSLYQEVELEAGVYTLEANSQGTWDDVLNDAVSLWAEMDGTVIASNAVQPGYGSFATDEFTLEEDSLVKVVVSFKLPAGNEAGIDEVKINKVNSSTMAKKKFSAGLDEEEDEQPQGEEMVLPDKDKQPEDEPEQPEDRKELETSKDDKESEETKKPEETEEAEEAEDEKDPEISEDDKNSDEVEAEKEAEISEDDKNSDEVEAEEKPEISEDDKNSDEAEAEKEAETAQGKDESGTYQDGNHASLAEDEQEGSDKPKDNKDNPRADKNTSIINQEEMAVLPKGQAEEKNQEKEGNE